jgi:hypothetical protein
VKQRISPFALTEPVKHAAMDPERRPLAVRGATSAASRLRKVLIISPRFPPCNAADMHRIRQSLPYLPELGWYPITLAVAPERDGGLHESELMRTIPAEAEIHHVRAFDARWTRKVGLGSLALRSLWFYRQAGNRLLARGDVDLVYFSTTEFPVMVLGAYWKRRFGVPYVIDMQDPWHTDHYTHRPRRERPRKHWFSYRLNKYLEPIAMRAVDGLISVSEEYCATLRSRYEHINHTPCAVIPFGGAEIDFTVLDELRAPNPLFDSAEGHCHVVYVGRGGHDMAVAAHALFGALADGLRLRPDLFARVRVHLVGTHYSRRDGGGKTLEPIAAQYGLTDRVREYPARVPYFTALQLLRQADMLLLLGSTSPGYTASKLYPYILARRQLLAVFSGESSVTRILLETGAGEVVPFQPDTTCGDVVLRAETLARWTQMMERLSFAPTTDWAAFEPYTARTMTRRQVEVFDRVAAVASRRAGRRTP